MSKLGVFLGFYPGDNLSIHGIGRLLAFILKGKESQSETVVLFCPEWLIDSLNKLLKDNKIPLNKFEIITTESLPAGVQLKNYLYKRKKKTDKVSKMNQFIINVKQKAAKLAKDLATNFFSTSSLPLLVSKSIIYIILAVVFSPVFALLGVVYLGYKVLSLLFKVLYRMLNKVLPTESLLEKLKTLARKGRGLIYQVVLDNELNKLVGIINKRTDIKVCYIPSMAWPETKNLKCKKILAAPDIVFYDFPTQFQGVGHIHERIRVSIESADHLICYSDYVKERHLVHQCGVDPKKITVIKHANINMNAHLKLSKSISNYMTTTQNASQIIKKYIVANYSSSHILHDCDIANLDYVIYSSQNRAHKNVFNLIKAIRIVNKEYFKNVKLILTGDISQVDYIVNYIKENHLQNDIIVMHNVSSEVLAALNHCAKCAVNPTLFEGGFPFTFSESFSVGTPSIMSNIPVINCEIDDHGLRDKMLFDAYNPYSIAQKIIWSVDHAQSLYEEQTNLYEKFDQRDWGKVVDEYNDVFNTYLL